MIIRLWSAKTYFSGRGKRKVAAQRSKSRGQINSLYHWRSWRQSWRERINWMMLGKWKNDGKRKKGNRGRKGVLLQQNKDWNMAFFPGNWGEKAPNKQHIITNERVWSSAALRLFQTHWQGLRQQDGNSYQGNLVGDFQKRQVLLVRPCGSTAVRCLPSRNRQSGHLHPKRNWLSVHLNMAQCFSTGARTAAAICLAASASTAGNQWQSKDLARQKKEDKVPCQQYSRRVA